MDIKEIDKHTLHKLALERGLGAVVGEDDDLTNIGHQITGFVRDLLDEVPKIATARHVEAIEHLLSRVDPMSIRDTQTLKWGSTSYVYNQITREIEIIEGNKEDL